MFDALVASTPGTSGASAVDAWTRVESAACARRVAAMVIMLDAACSRLLFPEFSRPTKTVKASHVPPGNTSGLTMPSRKATRAQDRAHRIQRERRLNGEEAEL